MKNLDSERSYMIQVISSRRGVLANIVVPGVLLDITVGEMTEKYPEFYKLVIYDADTKEAVKIIRP